MLRRPGVANSRHAPLLSNTSLALHRTRCVAQAYPLCIGKSALSKRRDSGLLSCVSTVDGLPLSEHFLLHLTDQAVCCMKDLSDHCGSGRPRSFKTRNFASG